MKNIISLFTILFIFSSCQKEDFNIINLNNNKISIFGHGGMGIEHTYPINSYESILKCLSLGADGTEIDVQMTKDSILVAYHDEFLERATNISGEIFSKTWKEISNTTYKVTTYTNYKIITLDELFSNIDSIKKYEFIFDCKLYTNNQNLNVFHNTYANALTKIIDKYDLKNNIYIESQSESFLKTVQQLNKNYKLFIYSNFFEEGLEIALKLNLYGITISTEDITKEQIEIAHNNNLLVAIFNTHSKNKNVEAVKKNADFIQSDKVKHLIKLLK